MSSEQKKLDRFGHGEIDLVVFDMGGTVIKDTGAVPEAFIATLHKNGIELSDDMLRQFRGASKKEVIGRLVKDEELSQRIFYEFRELLLTKFSGDGLQAIPGAEDTFKWLRARAVKVALNTGFDRAVTDLIIDNLGWKSTVDATACADDVPMGRPAPYLIFRAMEATGSTSVRRVVVAGDTVSDLQAGWNAGVRGNVGVLSGAHGREELERARHTHLIASVRDLPELFI